MYTRTNPPCPMCNQAKTLAKSKGLEFENIDIGTTITVEEFQTQFPNARSVPLILIDGDLVGGFVEFKNYLLSKSLGELSL
jgi:glutaredoxin